MKNTIRTTAAVVAVLLSALLMPGVSSASPSRDVLPKRTIGVTHDLRCKKVKPVRNDSTLEVTGDVAVTCRVKRAWGNQDFYVRRFKERRADLAPWVNGIASGPTIWGPIEESCFVKKGRHLMMPMNARGDLATAWCAYAQRRVGGSLHQGT